MELTRVSFCAGHLAEAKLEEVLDSLRLRIRSLFTWAKSDVNGFDDMSPLDQKALLRRTVPELVMLGFAKCSVPYDSESQLQHGWGLKVGPHLVRDSRCI